MSQESEADKGIAKYQKRYDKSIAKIDREVLILYGKNTNVLDNKLAIDTIIRDSGYNLVTSSLVNEGYQDIYLSTFDLYKRETGETWNFSDESLNKLMSQKQIDVDQFNSLSSDYLTNATRIITQGAVNNISSSIISGDLLKLSQKFTNNANVWTDTGYSAMLRSSNTLMAEDNGVEQFKYVGPGRSAKNIRPFCKKHVGEIKTIKEWNKLNNGSGQPGPVSVYLGGHRCRHLLTGVIDGQ